MKLKRILFLLIGLGTLVYILSRMGVNITDITKSIKSPEYVVLAIIAITALPLINGLRMKFIIYPLEKNKPSLHDLCIIEYMYKFLSNVMPFKLNVPAKAVLLSRKCGMKIGSSGSVVSFEYALDSILIVIFAFLGAFAFFRNDNRISLVSIEYFLVICLLSLVVFFSIPTDYFRKLLNSAEHMNLKIFRAIAIFCVKVLWSIRGTWVKLILHRGMIEVLMVTALIWGTIIFFSEVLFLSTGHYVPPTWIVVASSSGLFLGGISTIPGGLGVREAAMVLVYGYLGVPGAASVTVVLLNRILSTPSIIIGYFYSVKTGYDKIMRSN